MSDKTKKSFLDSFESSADKVERRQEEDEKNEAYQAAVIKKIEDEIRQLIKIIPKPYTVKEVRIDNCATFEVVPPIIEAYETERSYWNVGIYPYYNNKRSTACQLSIRFFPIGTMEDWEGKATSHHEAVDKVASALGKILGNWKSFYEKHSIE